MMYELYKARYCKGGRGFVETSRDAWCRDLPFMEPTTRHMLTVGEMSWCWSSKLQKVVSQTMRQWYLSTCIALRSIRVDAG